jgi:hypothetical protein
MSDNVFTVDLGPLKLTDEQKNHINSAIQKAVAGQLAEISLSQRMVLIPLNNQTRIPGKLIINGIIARSIEIPQLESFLQEH